MFHTSLQIYVTFCTFKYTYQFPEMQKISQIVDFENICIPFDYAMRIILKFYKDQIMKYG